MGNIIETKKLKDIKTKKYSILSTIFDLIDSHNNEKRTWYVSEESFPHTYIHLNEFKYNCSLKRLLLTIGIAMTSADSTEVPESWYAMLKHINTFSSNTDDLFVRSHIAKLDFHKKTIYADELGVGSSICILGDIYRVRFIADASDFIFNKKSYINGSKLSSKNPFKNKSLRGLYKKKLKPDFFCIANDRKVIIAEAKGSFGYKSHLDNPLQEGKFR